MIENVFSGIVTQPIFPSTFQNYTLNRKFTDEEIRVLSRKHNQLKSHGFGSNNQSVNNYILEQPELKQLKSEIQLALDNYFLQVYNPKHEASVYITQSWLNFNLKNEWHPSHVHPNSFLSGVLYVQTTKDDVICFTRPINDFPLTVEPKEYNLYNTKTWYVRINVGNLIIFPSSLAHYVPRKETDGERISLSFNTFLRGTLGTEENLTELRLP